MKASALIRYFTFFWVAILSIATLEYIQLKPDTGFLKLKQEAVNTGWYLPAFHSHIFGSSIILLAGFFQFSEWVRNNIKLHRLLGRVYVYGILFFAAPGAYVMCFFINRGNGVFASFLLQNSLWIVFTLSSVLAAKQGDINRHRAMACRSYALAFAAVTLRFYIWLFNVLGNGVNFENNYLIIALASWIPNLLIAEWVIGWRRNYPVNR